MTNETEQLRRLVDARERATKGDWKAIEHENKNAFEGNLVVTPNNMNDAVCTIWTCDANKETEENAEFIALAGSTDLRSILTRMEKMEAALKFYRDDCFTPSFENGQADKGQRARGALGR